jgi:hypothetical protein
MISSKNAEIYRQLKLKVENPSASSESEFSEEEIISEE